MARKELRTLGNIIDSVMDLLQVQSSDTITRNRIKGDVVRAYLDEVMPYSQWPWRRKKVNVQAQSVHTTGTASVTQNSTTVTLSTTLTTSRAGQLFSVNGQNDSYRIRSHTGGTATLILDNPYAGQTAATAAFSIWADTIPLPTDLEEIVEVTSPSLTRPLEGIGLQEIRRKQAAGPKSQGRPFYYSLDDWIDPAPYSSISGLPASATRTSAGLVRTIKFASTLGATEETALLKVGDRIRVASAGNYTYNIDAIVSSVTTTTNTLDTITYTALEALTESSTTDTGISITLINTESYERQKHLIIFPAINTTKTNISIDYVAELPPLDDDDDEPVIPLADRVVLFHLALADSYARERNLEEAAYWRAKAEQRLSKMAGRLTESVDKPSFRPSASYLATKRFSQRLRRPSSITTDFGSGGNATNPLGNINTVAVFGSDQTLQSDGLISTTELHALNGISSSQTIEERLDALEGSPTTASLTDNTTTTVTSWEHATYNTIIVDYSLKRSTAYEVGRITLITDGATVAIANGGIASFGTLGVTFSGDISGTDVRLRAALTSTGSNASMSYRVIKWRQS